MAFPKFYYSRDWRNPADYPAHQSGEEQNRADLQGSFTEWESYWNHTFLPTLEAAIASGGGSGSSGDGGSGSSGGSGGDSGGPYLPLAGGTLSGVLRLVRDPQMNSEAATKQYVDQTAENVVTDAGGDLTALRQRADEIEALAQTNQGDIASLRVRANEIAARVADTLDEEGVLDILADQISLSVSAPSASQDGDRVYSRITLKVGPNNLYGDILQTGNVDVSGQLSAEALYSVMGEIANLAVNQLVTSRRVAKYLAGDSTDDCFTRIYGQYLQFVVGSASGGTEQARNPDGSPLYWPVDVSGLPLGADGYPRQNGGRIYTTTTPTDYPVAVYSYTEAVKRSTHFELDEDGTTYIPIDTFGAGNSAGTNIVHMVKRATGFEILYTTAAGKIIGVRMGNDGYVDIAGLRRPATLDFSQWEEGKFFELLEGSSLPREYAVTFDALSRPVTITAPGGHVTNITW